MLFCLAGSDPVAPQTGSAETEERVKSRMHVWPDATASAVPWTKI